MNNNNNNNDHVRRGSTRAPHYFPFRRSIDSDITFSFLISWLPHSWDKNKRERGKDDRENAKREKDNYFKIVIEYICI